MTGFYRDKGTGKILLKSFGTGYFIPSKDLKGRVVSMQVRTDRGEKRYYSFSSSHEFGGAEMRPQMHFVGVNVNLPPQVIYLTEGALKADVAHYLSGGVPFASIPGVNNYRVLTSGLQELKDAGITSSTIILATDMDEEQNINVQNSIKKIKTKVAEAGFRIEQCKWPLSEAKGIDDYLLSQIKKSAFGVK